MEDNYIQGTAKRKLQMLFCMALFLLPYTLLQLGILSDPNSINTDSLTTDEREIKGDGLNFDQTWSACIINGAEPIDLNVGELRVRKKTDSASN